LQPGILAIFFAAMLMLVATRDPATAADKLERFSQRQLHMGVEFEIVLYAPDAQAAQKAFAAGFERIAQLDRTLSDYDEESELSRLSAASPTKEPVMVSDDLWTVLSYAQSVSRRSDGAFDVSVGPLTKLWRRARRQKEPPTSEQIAKALEPVGYQHIRLDADRKTVSLAKPAMRLDLGGIAKGYAADEALAAIGKLGIGRALVRASGDIAAGEPPPGESGWRVGIAPLDADATPTRFVSLAKAAISTSGDSRQHLVASGKRYSHIINPRTGWGIEGRSSVTVIAPRGIEADSLASAVSVLGPEAGLRLIEPSSGVAALIVTEGAGGEKMHRSQRFKQFEVP
jgi:thiamine biosynthesis lipoprotein